MVIFIAQEVCSCPLWCKWQTKGHLSDTSQTELKSWSAPPPPQPPTPSKRACESNRKFNCSKQQQKPEKEHQTAHAHASPPPTQPPHIHTHKHTNNSANLLVSIWSLVPHRVESDGGIRVNLLHATDPLVHLTVYLCHPYIGGTLLQHLQKTNIGLQISGFKTTFTKHSHLILVLFQKLHPFKLSKFLVFTGQYKINATYMNH